mgnify:CR=1 FL=1
MPIPSLAIIIINWNSYELTKDTLQSLQQTTYKDYDVILVDNASTDGSKERLEQEFPHCIHLASEVNRGFTGGNNIGVDYAVKKQYLFLMLLNNDVEVEANFLEPLLDTMYSNANIGAVQPLIYFHHDKNIIWNAGGKYLPFLGLSQTLRYHQSDPMHAAMQQEKKIDWITGCAFMVRTSVIQEIGPLWEAFFIYHEDVDWSFCISKAGYELVYVPSSVIYHIAGMSHKSSKKTKEGFVSPKVHYLNARNKIWLLKAHSSWYTLPTVVIYHAIYFFGIDFYFIFRRRWAKLKALNKGIWEGLTTYPPKRSHL